MPLAIYINIIWQEHPSSSVNLHGFATEGERPSLFLTKNAYPDT